MVENELITFAAIADHFTFPTPKLDTYFDRIEVLKGLELKYHVNIIVPFP